MGILQRYFDWNCHLWNLTGCKMAHKTKFRYQILYSKTSEDIFIPEIWWEACPFILTYESTKFFGYRTTFWSSNERSWTSVSVLECFCPQNFGLKLLNLGFYVFITIWKWVLCQSGYGLIRIPLIITRSDWPVRLFSLFVQLFFVCVN